MSAAELLKQAEEREIALCDSEDYGEMVRNATEQMLLYFFENRLEDARFLWRRSNPAIKTDTSLAAAWGVGQCLWQRNNVPEALRRLAHTAWGPSIAPLAAMVLDHIRQRELAAIGLVFSAIPLAQVAKALDLSDQHALDACRQVGWAYDATTTNIHPTPLAQADTSLDGLDQLQHLTAIVTQLTT
ncbi:hypothetical protein CTAYLR_003944 [Chrysophaeum taylorii]|uniref:CSN8/PSMD8/EIF3K domain-containing protein n=1 Tax=Chrysophaeum taylorii TaxID=2483200 RepID=A0AAD7U9X6_9STRA|nr:hypothetical protein CTAYLR_003944 [Chrysophaeum taylorii]